MVDGNVVIQELFGLQITTISFTCSHSSLQTLVMGHYTCFEL